MYQSIYNYAINHNIGALPPNRELKTVKGYIIINNGEYDGFVPCEKDPPKVVCPDIGSLNRSRPCIIAEKAGIVLCGAEKAGKVFGARYLEKHKLLLEIMKEGAETVWSLSQIYSFLLKIENNPSLKQEIAAKLDNIKEDHIISFRIDNMNAENLSDWHEWFDKWVKTSKGIEETDTVMEVQSALSGEMVIPVSEKEKFPMIKKFNQTPIASFFQKAFTSYGFEGSENYPISMNEAMTIKAGIDALLESKYNNCRTFSVLFWFEGQDSLGLSQSIYGLFNKDRDAKENAEGEKDEEFPGISIKGSSSESSERELAKMLSPEMGGITIGSSGSIGSIFHTMNYTARDKARAFFFEERKEKYEDVFHALQKWERDTSIERPVFQTENGKTIVTGYVAKGISNVWGILLTFLNNREASDIFKQISKEYGPSRMKLFSAVVFGDNIPPIFYDRALHTFYRALVYKNDPRSKKDLPVAIRVIKAYLIRNEGMSMIEERLSTDNRNCAYLCGRLIAVVEKLQESTLDNKAGSTVVTTYYPAFERQPLATLPKLRHLSEVYMRKLKRSNSIGLAISFDKKIAEIMDLFETELPNTFTRDERGMMAIGYYQQKADLYKKKESA